MIFVKHEDRWPFQWIGQCDRCRVGIRCNSKADVDAFPAKNCKHRRLLTADSSEGGEN